MFSAGYLFLWKQCSVECFPLLHWFMKPLPFKPNLQYVFSITLSHTTFFIFFSEIKWLIYFILGVSVWEFSSYTRIIITGTMWDLYLCILLLSVLGSYLLNPHGNQRASAHCFTAPILQICTLKEEDLRHLPVVTELLTAKAWIGTQVAYFHNLISNTNL